jgi:DNA-directed RNA polymerase beta' subunit
MFFINSVFVPPSRFRPESKLGEEKYLHDHTTILARIIESNNDLKKILTKQFKESDRELDKNRFLSQKDLNSIKTGEYKRTQFYGHALRRLKGQH